MIAYGVAWTPTDARFLIALECRNVLVSYLSDPGGRVVRYMPDRLFLDSGAFSAWTRRFRIPIDDYVAWSSGYVRHANDRVQLVVANLDIIPGGFAAADTASPSELVAAIREGMANADRLRAAGLRVAEVYHFGEPPEILGEILDRRQPGEMIALGGLAGRGQIPDKVRFVGDAFDFIRARYDGNVVPVHGFGIGPVSALGRAVPWYSVDASTWVNPRKFGHVADIHGALEMGLRRRNEPGEVWEYFRRVLNAWQRATDELSERWSAEGVEFVDVPGSPLVPA